MTPALLAHQGGWDELLFVLAPLLLFAGLLVVAKRRVDRLEGQPDTESGTASDEPAAPTTKPDTAES